MISEEKERELIAIVYGGIQPFMAEHLPDLIESHPELRDIDPELLGKLIQLGALYGLETATKALGETT